MKTVATVAFPILGFPIPLTIEVLPSWTGSSPFISPFIYTVLELLRSPLTSGAPRKSQFQIRGSRRR